MANDPCPGCGHVHEAPFSVEIRDIAAQLDAATQADERAALMIELADLYASDFDWTDDNLPEEMHGAVEDYLQLKAETSASAFRLGRLLMRLIGAYQRHIEGESSDPVRSPRTKKGVQPN
jgi:hypothetical protein